MVNIADARMFGGYADALILVLRSGVTTRDAALMAKNRFADDGIPVLGTILNFWNPKTPGYGYYQNYYAGYYHYYGDGGGHDGGDSDGGDPSNLGDVRPPPSGGWCRIRTSVGRLRGSPSQTSTESMVGKVLHVIPSVGPLRGGPSAMVRQLAASLVRSGIDTHVATTDDNGPGTLPARYGEPVVQDGVTYWYFPRQLRFYTSSWPLALWLAHHVADFDLVHIHALFSFAALPASYWAARRGVPYIVRPLGTLESLGHDAPPPLVEEPFVSPDRELAS